MFYPSALFSVLIFLHACEKQPAKTPDGVFEDNPVFIELEAKEITETSGMADSYKNPGHLWIHEDSGNPPAIHLLSHNGKLAKTIRITGTNNRDWEELGIGTGPQPGLNYIYIAETGDNNHQYPSYSYLRFPEPDAGETEIKEYETLRFVYPDGSHDSEAFFVAPASKDLYIITKREAKSRVYKLPFPQQTNSLNTAVFVGELPYSGVVAASLSQNGKELLIKTYPSIYYYRGEGSESVEAMLQKEGKMLGYETEVQGEAISFANNGSGFYTLSEKAFSNTVKMHFYKRK